jgi:hypothetical protein
MHASVRRSSIVGPLVGLLLAGCGVGTGTLRIGDAEEEVVAITDDILAAVGLTPSGPVTAAPLEQCELRSGDAGLRTRVTVRAPLDDAPERLAAAIDASATVLVARGLAIVESGVPGTLLGQRDGLTVTVGSDGRMLEVDALTGCRPR